jgi:hypothetical protein
MMHYPRRQRGLGVVDGIEAVGEAVTGSLLARAVEPSGGETGHERHANCLNCGTALTGEYCHSCGQPGHIHRTLGAFWHDVAHSVLHFDGKIWRTLPLLAWRPGELTRRFIEGERARFVSPMALFLFSVFLMFAVFSTIGGPFNMGFDAAQMRNTKADMAAELEDEKGNLAELKKEHAQAVRNSHTEEAQRTATQIKETEQSIKAFQTLMPKARSATVIGGMTGWKPFDDRVKKLNANPGLAIYKVQNNAYKFSWALIPISVPFVWLFFLHRRRYRKYKAYDHTIFVTYSITFMGLGLIVLSFLALLGLGGGWIGLAIALVPPIHIYRQLRGAYHLSRWSAVWRTLMLLVFACVAGVLFFLLLMALGVLG